MRITVITQPNCQPCRAVKRILDRADITYQTIDAVEHPGAAARVRALGYTGTPVTIVEHADGSTTHFHGYDPDKIDAIITEAKGA